MKITGYLFSFLLLASIWGQGQAALAASVSECLGQDTYETFRSSLAETVALNAGNIVMESYRTLDQYESRIKELNDSLLKMDLPDSVLKCLGIRVKWKISKADRDEQRAIANSILLSYLLLDESMLPVSIRGGRGPKQLRHSISHVTVVKSSFTFIGHAAGVYVPLSNRISYIDRYIDDGWQFLVEPLDYPQHFWTIAGPRPFDSCGPARAGAAHIVLHEYGHALDYSMGKWFRYSSSRGLWKKIRALHEVESPYGQTDTAEDFAESFASYLLQPLFQCYAPQKYAFFSKFVAINEEIYGSRRPFEQVDCGAPLIRELLSLRAKWVEEADELCKK